MKGVLERTAAWVARKKAAKLGVKSNSARSNEVPLRSPKRLSNNASMPIHASKDNKLPQLRHRSNSALDFCTPRHTRSRSAAQRKMDQAKDTGVKDTILDAQIFEVEDMDSDVANALDSHTMTVAMTPPSKVIEGTTSSSATPKWLTTSVSRKQNFLPVTIPIQQMVVKYIEKSPKPKRFKTAAHLDNDEGTGKWVAEIASYKPKDENKEASPDDFEITKVELGNMSRDSDNHFF